MRPLSTEPSASEAFEDVAVALDAATDGRLSPEALHEAASHRVMGVALSQLSARPEPPQAGVERVCAWVAGVLGGGGAALDNLGAVYEALLDLAVVRRATGGISVEETPRRRRSGVHYTPGSLTRSIVEVALRPLVMTPEGELRPPEAILGLRICDLAMGCGAFLLEAARALSGWLRQAVQAHATPLSDGEIRRRVIDSVLYGVDVDRVAVSVARAALDLFSGVEGASEAHLVHGDALARTCGEGRRWSGRFAEVFERPAAQGFDAILSNPPYLFGERRPAVEEADFELCRGQWDAWWLFVERGAAWSRDGASFGYALPDALLARESTQPIRVFLRERADQLWLRHEGAVFSASVSVVACCGWRGGARPSMAFEQVTPTGDLLSIHPLSDEIKASSRWWPPVSGGALEAWSSLKDLVWISRGEEVGKSSLRRLTAGPSSVGEGPILAGEGVSRAYGQPAETHAIERGRVRKAPRHYKGPKIVVVKTGKRLRAAIDRRGVLTLQSIYNVHLKPEAAPWASLEVVCGLLNAEVVDRRFIRPITSGKKLFPQITQRMIRDIRLPEPDADQALRIEGLVRRLEQGEAPEAEVALQEVFEAMFGGVQ